MGVFISADTVQGNAQGVNPYGYVGGNPETRTDPTGHWWSVIGGIVSGVVRGIGAAVSGVGSNFGAIAFYPVAHRSEAVAFYPVAHQAETPASTPTPTPAPTPAPTPTATPTADQILAGQKAASQIAFDAASNFRMASNTLAALAAIAAVLGLASWANPVFMGCLVGLGAAFALLAAAANEIAGRFSDQNNPHGLGWFTKANLASSLNGMYAVLLGYGGSGLLAGGGLMDSAVLAVEKIAAKAFTGAMVGGMVFTLTDLIGTGAMVVAVNKIVAEEERMVLT